MTKPRENTPPDVERGEAGRWLPGKSPNPGGRPKSEKEVAKAIQLRGQELVDRLFTLSEEGNVPAIKELFERGYGKAKQVIELTGHDGGPIQTLRIDVTKLTQAQLEVLQSLRGGNGG